MRMAYRRSPALDSWLGPRRQSLEVLAAAHRHLGRVPGSGWPADAARPLAHACVLQLVADFQGFAREVHDLAVHEIVRASGVRRQHEPELVLAVTEGRALDRGNADLSALQRDFRRLGIGSLGDQLRVKDNAWTADRASLAGLVELRNAIAHGNARQLVDLRERGIHDTRSWTTSRRPALTRIARALDQVVWDHLEQTFRRKPW